MPDDLDDDLDPEQGNEDHHVPADLLELHEVLEWESAVAGRTALLMPKAGAPTVGSFVTRAGWGARPSRGVTRLSDPPGVTWHYEGPRMGTFPHESCPAKVRGIQAFHMDGRGWTDGAYNLIVCPHGVVYELRGRDVRSAANGTNTGNSSSHAICALTGVGDAHPPALFSGLLAARQYLMGGGTGSRTWGHRDWKATSCPGDPIYQWFKAGMSNPGPAPTPTPQPTPTPPIEETDDMFSDTDRKTLQRLAELYERRSLRIVTDGTHPAVYIVADGGAYRVWVTSGRHLVNLGAAYGFDPHKPEVWARDDINAIPLLGDEAPGVTAPVP